jgi:hypothetical protein
MTKFFRIGASLASAAALSLAATPALARDWGWGGGHYRHHDRVDAGDIFAGILIIGGIAAIASAASKSKKERERRAEDYRYPDDGRDQSRDYGRDDRTDRSDNRPDWSESRGINDAIDRCASEVERGDRRIESVESVNREAGGWRVAGRMQGGKDFSCTIDRDGRIRSIDLDGTVI